MAKSYRLIVGGVPHDVEVYDDAAGLSVLIDGVRLQADLRQIEGPLLTLLLSGQSFEVVAVEQPDGYEVLIDNQVIEVEIERPERRRGGVEQVAAGGGSMPLKAPMTGMVVDVAVAVGDAITAGQVLVVVESMKMNNELRAPRDGAVQAVHIQRGQRIERNAVLVTIQ